MQVQLCLRDQRHHQYPSPFTPLLLPSCSIISNTTILVDGMVPGISIAYGSVVVLWKCGITTNDRWLMTKRLMTGCTDDGERKRSKVVFSYRLHAFVCWNKNNKIMAGGVMAMSERVHIRRGGGRESWKIFNRYSEVSILWYAPLVTKERTFFVLSSLIFSPSSWTIFCFLKSRTLWWRTEAGVCGSGWTCVSDFVCGTRECEALWSMVTFGILSPV